MHGSFKRQFPSPCRQLFERSCSRGLECDLLALYCKLLHGCMDLLLPGVGKDKCVSHLYLHHVVKPNGAGPTAKVATPVLVTPAYQFTTVIKKELQICNKDRLRQKLNL